MEELDITWVRAFKIWWSLIWRGLLYGIVLSIVLGFPLGLIANALGLEQAQAQFLIQNVIALCGLFLGIWILKVVLSKSYSDFRIVLVPSDEALLNRLNPGSDEKHDGLQ